MTSREDLAEEIVSAVIGMPHMKPHPDLVKRVENILSERPSVPDVEALAREIERSGIIATGGGRELRRVLNAFLRDQAHSPPISEERGPT